MESTSTRRTPAQNWPRSTFYHMLEHDFMTSFGRARDCAHHRVFEWIDDLADQSRVMSSPSCIFRRDWNIVEMIASILC